MNTKLLLEIKDRILEEPRRLSMGDWILTDQSPDDIRPALMPSCNTVACIAGWAVLLTHSRISAVHIPDLAKQISKDWLEEDGATALGLTRQQEKELFFVKNWPLTFKRRYDVTFDWPPEKRIAERAKITAERIDAFIAQYGGETKAET